MFYTTFFWWTDICPPQTNASCTSSLLLAVCWPGAQSNETTTFLLVTLPNIYRFKKNFLTRRPSNKRKSHRDFAILSQKTTVILHFFTVISLQTRVTCFDSFSLSSTPFRFSSVVFNSFSLLLAFQYNPLAIACCGRCSLISILMYVDVCNAPFARTAEIVNRSTFWCPGSLNRVPALAGVRAGMSPLPGGR